MIIHLWLLGLRYDTVLAVDFSSSLAPHQSRFENGLYEAYSQLLEHIYGNILLVNTNSRSLSTTYPRTWPA